MDGLKEMLAICDEKEICSLFDTGAFNEIVMCYVRAAVNGLSCLDDEQKKAVRNRVSTLLSEQTAGEITGHRMTVDEVIKKNSEDATEIPVIVEYEKQRNRTEYLFEGMLADVPEKYRGLPVVSIGRSMAAEQDGRVLYYILTDYEGEKQNDTV